MRRGSTRGRGPRLLIAGLLAAAALAAAQKADATPTQKCGGQLANRPAPFVCYNEKTVGGVLVRVDVVVNADRTFAVTYSLPNGPINQILGLQAVAHAHLSSDPNDVKVIGTMPAGGTSALLTGTFPAGNLCDGHQFDIKAWPGNEGSTVHWSPTLRISGATFVFATNCVVTTTTTVPTTVPTTVGTTVPGQSTVPSTLPARVAGCTLSANGVYVNDLTGQPCSTPSTGDDLLGWVGVALILFSIGGIFVIGVKIYQVATAPN